MQDIMTDALAILVACLVIAAVAIAAHRLPPRGAPAPAPQRHSPPAEDRPVRAAIRSAASPSRMHKTAGYCIIMQ